MQKLTLPIMTFILMMITLFLVVPSIQSTDTIFVDIDGSATYQTIEGWAIWHLIDWNWEGLEQYPIPQQDVMNQIKELGIDYIRNIPNYLMGNVHEYQNDNMDPYSFNWNYYNTQLASMKHIFERMQYQKNAGLKIGISSHSKPPWMFDVKGHLNTDYPNVYAELAEYWAALLIHLRDNYGVSISYISIQIEPDWALTAPSWLGFDKLELRNAIVAVGSRLREEGFDTMIIAPDAGTAENTREYCQTILSDSEAKNYVDNISYHPYDKWSGRDGPDIAIPYLLSLANDNLVKNSGLPLWMTEWSSRRDGLGDALNNAKMIYNTHVYGNTSLYLIWTSIYDWGYDKDGNGILENGGIFGPGVTNGKLNLKKYYGFALSQYTKYIRPGAKRVEAKLHGGNNVYVTAYRHDINTQFTIEFINRGTSAYNINVVINDIQYLVSLNAIRTSATENSAYLGQIEIKNNSFSYLLPGVSITTFTTMSTDNQEQTKKGKIRR